MSDWEISVTSFPNGLMVSSLGSVRVWKDLCNDQYCSLHSEGNLNNWRQLKGGINLSKKGLIGRALGLKLRRLLKFLFKIKPLISLRIETL